MTYGTDVLVHLDTQCPCLRTSIFHKTCIFYENQVGFHVQKGTFEGCLGQKDSHGQV